MKMRLISFSVTNYRSITTAHKISLGDYTVLVGRNNEGKSNLLTALNVAMEVLIHHARLQNRTGMRSRPFFKRNTFEWVRDFPIQLQERKRGLESIFKLEFRLEGDELSEFQKSTGIRGNEDIPIEIKFDKQNNHKITVKKKGTSSYNKKSSLVAGFISERLSFNYIQAVRTDQMAIDVLENAIAQQLFLLRENDEYIKAIEKIDALEQNILDNISNQLIEPLKLFLPNLRDVKITKGESNLYNQIRYRSNNIEIIIDDGIATSISYKGDGIKSLATLAILKDKAPSSGASIIAIEEPESHLHSGAIHNLVDVIMNVSKNNQVIITTHNPLFVQRNNLKSNIIVNNGKATPAKSISEIRDILGVLPEDNLRNASNVLVVEGEDDKKILSKILSLKSPKIESALSANKLVIKPLGGAGNLSHSILDLKNNMCIFFILLDNDKAGLEAINKAKSKNLVTEANYKLTICKGSKESEIEDCINKQIYADILLNEFQIDLNSKEFRNNKKWSDRIKNVRNSTGGPWDDKIEAEIKSRVADCVSESERLDDILIEQKSGFIDGLVVSLEKMLDAK